MNQLIKSILVSFISLVLISACSTGSSLQSLRMDEAEQQIILAEQALAQPSTTNSKVALENAGTATAYLATVRDYIKFLTPNEKARLQTLQQRVDKVTKRAYQ